MRSVICAAAVAVVLAGAAAAQAPMAPPEPACREAPASFALGQRYSNRLGRQARRAAGAGLVRKIEPGKVYTMEFRADRLNLEVGPQGRIRAIRCG